jgi:4-amino-4-deoxy-L-arabinose transferase-like glycosyltransferase
MDIPIKKTIAILLLFLLFILGVNSVWILTNQRLPFDDTAGHTTLTFIYAHIWKGTFDFPSLMELFKISQFYPPFLFIISSILPVIFGFNHAILQYWSQLLLGFSVVCLFFYTRILFNNNKIALFSSLLFLSIPHVWEQSRWFMLDIPLTGCILATLYALEQSKGFKHIQWFMIACAFASFAQLTKWYACVYLFIPAVWSIMRYQGWVFHLKKHYLAVFLSMVISTLVITPWYLFNWTTIATNTSLYLQADGEDPQSLFSFLNII